MAWRYLKRSLEPVLIKAAGEFPAVVLTGPRQSGKTTLLKQLFGETYGYVSLEPPDVRAAAAADPRGFLALKVRPVKGLEGSPNLFDTSNDVLIIGVGYETELIVRVAKYKEKAKKIQVFGLPSLRADMYQENVIKVHNAMEAVGIGAFGHVPNNYFAPAHDPFVYAQVLKNIVDAENEKERITNLYLSPLATKPQVLGFTLYYLTECLNKNDSIIFPFCFTYSRRTSKDISRIWKYDVELAE